MCSSDLDQGAEHKIKGRDYVLKDLDTRQGANNRRSFDLVFHEDGINTGRGKIQKLDDWRSERPHKGYRDRKDRHDEDTSYNRSGNQSCSRRDNRDYSKHQSRSRDKELISMTEVRKDDDRRKGDHRKKDANCHRRSSRC